VSPEEPRDSKTSLNIRLFKQEFSFYFFAEKSKPVDSLFIISDVNGNLVEYVLDVVIDTSKLANHKATNDTPIQLKITPKAQWSLQRFVASDELRYPLQPDNPLISNRFSTLSLTKTNKL